MENKLSTEELPKFNLFSFHVMNNCKDVLLPHQSDALQFLVEKFSANPQSNGAAGDASEATLPKRPRSEAKDFYLPLHAGVSMPTGSGKTGIICCLPYYLGSIGLKKPLHGSLATGNPRHHFKKPILVLAPNLDIANQLYGQIAVAGGISHKNFLLGKKIVHRDDQKRVLPDVMKIDVTDDLTDQYSLERYDVIIANVHKFLSKKTREESPKWVEKFDDNLFSFVIVDEAHHFPAPTWVKILNKFKHHAGVIFFTATPYRSDEKERVVLGKELWFHLTLEDARENKIIRRTNPVPVGPENFEEADEGVVYEEVLQKIKEIQERKNREQPLPNNVPHMAIAIVKNQHQCNEVAKRWNQLFKEEKSAIAYHTGKSDSQQKEMMKKIEENEVKLVVVVGKLLEGFDHPPISIAAILTKIGSPVKFTQFIGRAQRICRTPVQEEGTIEADIVMHSFYQQQENYHMFENELFIKI